MFSKSDATFGDGGAISFAGMTKRALVAGWGMAVICIVVVQWIEARRCLPVPGRHPEPLLFWRAHFVAPDRGVSAASTHSNAFLTIPIAIRNTNGFTRIDDLNDR